MQRSLTLTQHALLAVLMIGSANSQATTYLGYDWTTNSAEVRSPCNWYKASDFVAKGTTWPDRGNQSNHMTQFFGGITKKVLNTETGKSSVTFAKEGNANAYIESQSNNSWMTGNFYGSYMIVAKVPLQSTYSCFLSQGREQSRRNFCAGFNSGGRMVVDGQDGGPRTHNQVRRADWAVYTYVMYLYWSHPYNHWASYFYVNNVDQGKGAYGTFWQQNYNNKLRIGSWRTTDANYKFEGEIAEILTWNRKINSTDRTYVNERMCAKYVCKQFVMTKGNGFVTERVQEVWPYETQARSNYVYTHPATVRPSGMPTCCRQVGYKAFMKGNTNVGATTNLLSTGSTPIGYHTGNRQITFKTAPLQQATVVHTVVIRTYIMGNDAISFDVEVKFTIKVLKAVDGLTYKLPIYHYHADDYDGSSVWKDRGQTKNNMTKRGNGLVTKQKASNGASFNTVKFAQGNHSSYNPYLQQVAKSVLFGKPNMTVLIYAKQTHSKPYNCLFSQGQDSGYHEFCFGSFYEKMGTDSWTSAGRKTTAVTQVKTDFAIYSFTTKGDWLTHKNTLQVRVNEEVKTSAGYGNTPQYIYEDYAKLGSWHPSSTSFPFWGEIAEAMIWNESIADKDLVKEERKMYNKYVCATTQFKWTSNKQEDILTKNLVCKLPDGQETATCTYTFPEIITTVIKCDVPSFKAYYEKSPSQVFTAESTPVAIVDTLKDPRKFVFSVNRDMAQTTVVFQFEAHIPNITPDGLFYHQMSWFVDGKKRLEVTSLKAASFSKTLLQIEKLTNGDRVYQISKFQQEPEVGLAVTMELKSASGVSFNEKSLKLTVDSDVADKGEKIEVTITGSVQNLDGAKQPKGDKITAEVTYEIEFPKEKVLTPKKAAKKDAATSETKEDEKAAAGTEEASTDAKDTGTADTKESETKDDGTADSADLPSISDTAKDGKKKKSRGAVTPDEKKTAEEAKEPLKEVTSIADLQKQLEKEASANVAYEEAAVAAGTNGKEKKVKRIVPTVSAKMINKATIDLIPDIRISQKDMKKFAQLKRESRKEEPKGEKLKVKPPKVSEAGEMAMKFSKPIVVFGGGKMPDKTALVMKMVKSDSLDPKKARNLAEAEEEEDDNAVTFEVTEFTEEGMKINLDFSNPLAISAKNGESDRLQMALAPDTFFAQGSYEAISGTLELDVKVPKQFASPEEAAKTRGIALGIKWISYTIILGSFCMQLVWSGSLQNVWPMFNAIQLLTILTTMNIDMPSNVHLVLSEIRKIICLEDAIAYFSSLNEEPLVSGLSHTAGILVAVVLPIVAILTIFICVVDACHKKYQVFRDMYAWIKRRIFFSLFLRLIFITYVYVVVAARVGSLLQFDDFSFSYWSPLAVIYISMVAYACTVYLQFTEIKELEQPDTRLSFGTVYQNLITDEDHALLTPSVFFFRRVIFVMSLQHNVFAFKMGGIILCVMGQLVFMVNIKPYASKWLGMLEYFNEIILLLCSYMLPSFTGMIPELKANYQFGWVFCYILIPFFIVNIACIVFAAVDLIMKFTKDKAAKDAFDKTADGKKQAKIDAMWAKVDKKGDWGPEIAPKKVFGTITSGENRNIKKELRGQEAIDGKDFMKKAEEMDAQLKASRTVRSRSTSLKIGAALTTMKSTGRSRNAYEESESPAIVKLMPSNAFLKAQKTMQESQETASPMPTKPFLSLKALKSMMQESQETFKSETTQQ